MCPSGSTRTVTRSDAPAGVTLFLTSGEILKGEILSGNGHAIVVGLAASKRGRLPLGKPIGFELNGAEPAMRLPVVATQNNEQDGISTVRLVLSNRALIGGSKGSAQAALFNERASFRLPVNRESVTEATICMVTASTRAPRLGGTRASIRGPRHKAAVLDVSFDGLGLRVSKEADANLTSASDIHIKLQTTVGLITVEGIICHRSELPRSCGARYGIAAGLSTAARWRDDDERLLRQFVTEQQRATLERLRRV